MSEDSEFGVGITTMQCPNTCPLLLPRPLPLTGHRLRKPGDQANPGTRQWKPRAAHGNRKKRLHPESPGRVPQRPAVPAGILGVQQTNGKTWEVRPA